MSRTVAFAYPGARVQAQYGQLLGEGAWQRLARIPDLALFISSARDTALRPWVVHLDRATEPHQVEAHLRARYRRRVQAVAQWAPRAWRPSVRFLQVLPELPVVAHAPAGGETHPWMTADPALVSLLPRASKRRPGSGAPDWLEQARARGRPLPEAWVQQWRALWPPVDADERASLERLVRLLEDASRRAPHDDAATLMTRVQTPLRRLFRRHTRAPAGLFAYLALLWIERARLRGALLRRRLSLPAEEVAA